MICSYADRLNILRGLSANLQADALLRCICSTRVLFCSCLLERGSTHMIHWCCGCCGVPCSCLEHMLSLLATCLHLHTQPDLFHQAEPNFGLAPGIWLCPLLLSASMQHAHWGAHCSCSTTSNYEQLVLISLLFGYMLLWFMQLSHVTCSSPECVNVKMLQQQAAGMCDRASRAVNMQCR